MARLKKYMEVQNKKILTADEFRQSERKLIYIV